MHKTLCEIETSQSSQVSLLSDLSTIVDSVLSIDLSLFVISGPVLGYIYHRLNLPKNYPEYLFTSAAYDSLVQVLFNIINVIVYILNL